MEKKLKKMFDFQHFAHNERLDNMMIDAENDMCMELGDDELSFVAGGMGSDSGKQEPHDAEDPGSKNLDVDKLVKTFKSLK